MTDIIPVVYEHTHDTPALPFVMWAGLTKSPLRDDYTLEFKVFLREGETILSPWQRAGTDLEKAKMLVWNAMVPYMIAEMKMKGLPSPNPDPLVTDLVSRVIPLLLLEQPTRQE